MKTSIHTPCLAFLGCRCVARGTLREVAEKVKSELADRDLVSVLILDDRSSEVIEVDFRGTVTEVLGRLPAAEEQAETPVPGGSVKGPGRPKLGVVAREVTLLPRHWDWLGQQPGGASVALRRLVEDARRANADADRLRHAQESAYRFMTTMAGNEPGYEEATRALFAGRRDRFREMVVHWPHDLREHAMALAARAFSCEPDQEHAGEIR